LLFVAKRDLKIMALYGGDVAFELVVTLATETDLFTSASSISNWYDVVFREVFF
jgi:hypothetical protein